MQKGPTTFSRTGDILEAQGDDKESEDEREKQGVRKPSMPQHVPVSYPEVKADNVGIGQHGAQDGQRPEPEGNFFGCVGLPERKGDKTMSKGSGHNLI